MGCCGVGLDEPLPPLARLGVMDQRAFAFASFTRFATRTTGREEGSA